MSEYPQHDQITEAVGVALQAYLRKAGAQMDGRQDAAKHGGQVGRLAGYLQAAATIHAGVVSALATAEAARVQAAALDRLAHALENRRPRKPRCPVE